MRQAGRIVATVMEVLTSRVAPGMRTRELDAIAAAETKRLGGRPSFKGYRGFPASLCVSVNDEIVHGIPGERVLQEGDIVSCDLGAVVEGFQGDVDPSRFKGADAVCNLMEGEDLVGRAVDNVERDVIDLGEEVGRDPARDRDRGAEELRVHAREVPCTDPPETEARHHDPLIVDRQL